MQRQRLAPDYRRKEEKQSAKMEKIFPLFSWPTELLGNLGLLLV